VVAACTNTRKALCSLTVCNGGAISDVLLLLLLLLLFVERLELKELHKQYDKSEDDLKSLQSVGQMIGEVLRQLDDERCMLRNSCRK
jgi:hypothetical protein